MVRDRDIVGIFDMDYCSVGKRTREFLKKAQASGAIIETSPELPKSFIVCAAGDSQSVYISGVSAATIKKRALAGAEGLKSQQ